MSISIREQLLDAITKAVGGCYKIPAPGMEDTLPITVVEDDDDQGAEGDFGVENIVMRVAVGRREEAFSALEEDLRAQANAAYADIYQLMHVDPTFGGLADGIAYESGVILTDAGKFVEAVVAFNVLFHHALGDPFTLEPEA